MPETPSPFRRNRPRWKPDSTDQPELRELPGMKLRVGGPFRTTLIAFVVALICFGLLYAWVFTTQDEAVEGLAQAVDRAAASGGEEVLDLAVRTEFAWDRVFILPPYTDAEAAAVQLGEPAGQAAEQTRIGERDDITVLAFSRSGELVEVIAFPRDRGDFSVVDRARVFDRADAIFYVEPMPGQPDWLNVWPANP